MSLQDITLTYVLEIIQAPTSYPKAWRILHKLSFVFLDFQKNFD